MLLYLIIIIGVMALVLYVSSPEFKVKLGEIALTSQAKNHLGAEYQLLNNVELKDDQKTLHIDHILLSPYGIFVIETNNIEGDITGSLEQQNWASHYYKTSFAFKNPLLKNQHRVVKVQSLLAELISPDQVHSVVVFGSQSHFKKYSVDKTDMRNNVVKGIEWIDYVKQFDQPVISVQLQQRIQNQIAHKMLKREVTPAHIPVERLEDKRAA